MDRYRDDLWIANPPSVTSSFTLKPKGTEQNRVTWGETCGFGWRFGVRTAVLPPDAISADSFPASDTSPTVRLRIEHFFDPLVIRGAELGEVLISAALSPAEASSLLGLGGQSQSVTLPLPPPDGRPFPALGISVWTGCVDYPPIISFHLKFSTALGLVFPVTPPSQTLKLLSNSLLGVDQTDVKFYLFSRRNSVTGQKTHLQPVFASAQVLRGHSSHLDSCLSRALPDSIHLNKILHSAFNHGRKGIHHCRSRLYPPEVATLSDEYDYDSDSDLDTDDGDQIPSPSTSPLINPGESAYSSPRSATEIEPTPISGESLRRPGRVGQTIFIPHTSYKTWKAFIWYLYTRTINFQPLSSNLQVQKIAPSIGDSAIPPCSPKSMYRLADKLGIKELRILSLAAIQFGITKENILKEMFCTFTSYYSEIQELESTFLVSHFASIPADEIDRAEKYLERKGFPHPVGILWKVICKSLSSSPASQGQPSRSQHRPRLQRSSGQPPALQYPLNGPQ
ncbi:hypothetical protein BD779DRAFT_1503732 [Infundibulicybe gibba]|nr:hypothetical protein BD779DRAFT_1503732 [Infundibulicybe gibba]